MHTAVIIPCRPDDARTLLPWTLEGFSNQQLRPDHSMEVLVGIDGDEDVPARYPGARENIRIYSFPRQGAAAVRNALVAQGASHTDLLIFGNADARPEPDMVQVHADTITRLPARHLLLGSAPWERSEDPSVFDTLIDQMPMIFSYCHMKPHTSYPFRCAYTLNLSVRRSDFIEVEGFHEQLRPVYYEDLAFACRIIGPEKRGVVFEPAARVLHRHPLTIDQYLDREELLGIMAPVLARVCPEAFAALMAHRNVDQIARDFSQRQKTSTGIYASIYRRFVELGKTSHTTLGQGDACAQRLLELYQVHLPLKLMAFRSGFLRGMELRDDARWQERRPQGLWRRALDA